jgi:hypothetical protein
MGGPYNAVGLIPIFWGSVGRQVVAAGAWDKRKGSARR